MPVGKYGRKPPKNAPALRLGELLSGVVPDHPSSVDYLRRFGTWNMLGNDQYGDCVAVTASNFRRLITSQAGHEVYPDMDWVIKVYKTQNPGFPGQDDGMDIQTLLEWLVNVGTPDGVRAVAFAKVDYLNEAELDAALAIFGGLWIGFNVTSANERQFDAGQPWDYVSGSPYVGGHSVFGGGYRGVTSGGDVQFVTWAQQTSFTDTCRTRQWEEAWVVIWPEHWTMEPFLTGIDQQKLADAFQAITGRSIVPPAPAPPVPPPPSPEPVPDPDPTGCLHQTLVSLEKQVAKIKRVLKLS